MDYSYRHCVYRERAPYFQPKRQEERSKFSRAGPSAFTQDSTKRSHSTTRYESKVLYPVVNGKIEEGIEVLTEKDGRTPPRAKHRKHRSSKIDSHRHRKSTKHEAAFEDYHSEHNQYSIPPEPPRSWSSDDVYSYHGNEPACSRFPDIWEAGSTVSDASKRSLPLLEAPMNQLLLEAPPTRGSTRPSDTAPKTESVFSGYTTVSRGRQPHREGKRWK